MGKGATKRRHHLMRRWKRCRAPHQQRFPPPQNPWSPSLATTSAAILPMTRTISTLISLRWLYSFQIPIHFFFCFFYIHIFSNQGGWHMNLCCQNMREEYGMFVWPCSIILAEYVCQQKSRFAGASVIEVYYYDHHDH